MKVTSTDDPPKLINGSGMPVTGMIPIVHPDVDEYLEHEHRGDPAAIRLPYKFFESVMMRSARQISRA